MREKQKKNIKEDLRKALENEAQKKDGKERKNLRKEIENEAQRKRYKK